MSSAEKHKCPACGVERGRITDSRPGKFDPVIRRRRYLCMSCDYRWTTHEVIAGNVDTLAALRIRADLDLFLEDLDKAARARFGSATNHRKSDFRMKEGDQ